MCRFIAYTGEKILVSKLVAEPQHSLIHQSYESQLQSRIINADGFGFGWYNKALDPEPGLYTSISPAWSEANLLRLAKKIESNCIFAHIRDATPGMPVNIQNCHPFQKGNYLWMHNGKIASFSKIFRKLRSTLRDELYQSINGTTDSEHAFSLFLNTLESIQKAETPATLANSMLETIAQINRLNEETGELGKSFLNFALTDGETLLITRYTDSHTENAPSLFYSEGTSFECDQNGICHFQQENGNTKSIIVASEPLTDNGTINQWKEIPPKTLLIIDKEKNIKFKSIPVP